MPITQEIPTAAPADYRQLEAPATLPEAYRLPNSGGADAASALADTFKSFSKDTSGLVDVFQKQRGAAAGAADGAAGTAQPKTGLAAITAYGSSYDAAAHVSYINSTQTSVERQLSDAEQQFQGDPVGFKAQADAIHDATVKNAPPLWQPEISQMISQRANAGITRTQQQAVETARSDAWSSYTESRDGVVRAGLQTAATLPADQQTAVVQKLIADDQDQRDALVKARAISPEKSAILGDKFRANVELQIHGQYTAGIVDKMMDVARSGDVDSADRMLHDYVTDPNNTAADKNAVTQDYLSESEKFQKLQSRVLAPELASVSGELTQGSNQIPGQGGYGPDIEARIHALYKQGAINPEAMTSLLDHSIRNQVSAIGDDATNQLFDAAIHGTGPKLDPKDEAVKKGADTYFKSHVMINGVSPGTDAYAIGAANFVKQTNIVPPMVQSQIRVGLMNGDADSAVRAAQLAERITQANPQAEVYQNDPKLASLSNLINDNVRAGLPAAQAYAMAVKHVDIPPAEAKVRSEAYSAALKQQNSGNADATNAVALQKSLNSAAGFFHSAPTAPIPLQAEYDSLVKQYYTNTADLPKSQALAFAQVQKRWGMTKVNGEPELVKYPIADNDVPMIRADVANAATAAGYKGDPSELKLTPNALTDQSQGRYWTLTHTDKNGVTDVINDTHNQPIVYDVRQSPEDYAKQRQALIDSKLDAARKQRDVERSMAADQIATEKQLSDYYLTPQGQRRSANSVENR